MSVRVNDHENRVLGLLSPQDLGELPLTLATLESQQVLCAPRRCIEHVYFPATCVVSWLIPMQSDECVEVATIGNEGIVGFRALLGAELCPAKIVVQVPGQAWRLDVNEARVAAQPGSQLAQLIHRYINAFIAQITQTVACNTFHDVEKRLSRWLLMTHDRARSDHFPMTHESLAQMLGVRRASVSVVARKLQNAGAIRYSHGKITVLDRQILESTSCTCYAAVKAEFEHWLSQ